MAITITSKKFLRDTNSMTTVTSTDITRSNLSNSNSKDKLNNSRHHVSNSNNRVG